MTYSETLRELKSLGTAQNCKVYRRHGIGEKMYGVSFANLNKLQKKIKTDHDLAQKLWSSGNHDARVLATMIADPQQATGGLLDAWKKDLDNYVITDAFANYTGNTRFARRRMEQWTQSKQEWVGRAGWLLLARAAMDDHSLPDHRLEQYLTTIEKNIHDGQNRVRDAMNSALIAIGIRNSKLREKAIAAARRIGRVEVDHGETNCKTPAAEPYILKTWARKKSKGVG